MTYAALVLAAGLLPTQAPAQPPEHDPTVELRQAEKVGRAIYDHDQAAWAATDAVTASFPSSRTGLRGWITDETSDGLLVRFIASGPDGPCASVDALRRRHKPVLTRHDPCEPLMGRQLAMFRAVGTAGKQLDEPCSDRYNTVVLPARLVGEDGWLVYLLAATTDPGEILLGGHYRLLISPDGNHVIEKTRLSNGCMSLSLDDLRRSEEVTGAVVTHVVSDYPVETHVFLSLQHHLPIYVVTRTGAWRVREGKIDQVATPEQLSETGGKGSV